MNKAKKWNLFVLLFPKFESLDVFGPVEAFGMVKEKFTIRYVSLTGGIVPSAQGAAVMTEKIDKIVKTPAILLIPGGPGTRELIKNNPYLHKLRFLAKNADYLLSVCTGSGLLGAAGLLDGKRATTNKRAFDQMAETSDQVEWVPKARWVVDIPFYTSSGVSAGIDMTLQFIADLYDVELAEMAAERMEYLWNRNPDNDPFSV